MTTSTPGVRKVAAYISFILILAAIWAMYAVVLRLLWNAIIPDLFPGVATAITYPQMLGVIVMIMAIMWLYENVDTIKARIVQSVAEIDEKKGPERPPELVGPWRGSDEDPGRKKVETPYPNRRARNKKGTV